MPYNPKVCFLDFFEVIFLALPLTNFGGNGKAQKKFDNEMESWGKEKERKRTRNEIVSTVDFINNLLTPNKLRGYGQV